MERNLKKNEEMQNQALIDGEYRAVDDPDGVKRKVQKRGYKLYVTIPNIFLLICVALFLAAYFGGAFKG